MHGWAVGVTPRQPHAQARRTPARDAEQDGWVTVTLASGATPTTPPFHDGRFEGSRPARQVKPSAPAGATPRSPRQDDRLGEVVVCPGSRLPPRSPGRRPGSVSGICRLDQPSCMIPRSLPGAMPAMSRRVRRFTSFAHTDTAVRLQAGRRPMLIRERIGICTLYAPYASDATAQPTCCVAVRC